MKIKTKTRKDKGKFNFLELVPDKNCRWDRTGDGRFYLLVPRFKNQWMKKLALRLGRSESVKIFLDPTGSKVWGLIDGKTTVEQIGKLMEQGQEQEKEAGQAETVEKLYDRLTEFLTILSRNKFIYFRNY